MDDELDPGLLLKLPQSAARELRQKFELKTDLSLQIQHESKEEEAVVESLPLILVNLERLTGYQPEGERQKEELLESLRNTLFNETTGAAHLDGLLQHGYAFHSDTTSVMTEDASLHALHYPECIGELSTRHMWRAVQRPRSIPVVERLVQHLRVCHRPLDWKYGIQRELDAIVNRMEEHNLFVEWNTSRRKQKLERLYLVRETMQHQHEMAQEEQARLEEERECLVEEELNLLNGGISGFFVGEAHESEDDDEYEPYVPTDLDDEELDEKSATSGGDSDENISGSESHATDDEETAIPESDEANDRPDVLREQFTTEELRAATAKCASLEEQLERVDALLESLQEEEWEKEEEGPDDDVEEQFDERTSVLHSILAMTLMALDFQPADREQHTKNLKLEHYTVIRDWKEYFGHLPPPLPVNQSKLQDERQRLGIEDNEEEDWDAQD